MSSSLIMAVDKYNKESSHHSRSSRSSRFLWNANNMRSKNKSSDSPKPESEHRRCEEEDQSLQGFAKLQKSCCFFQDFLYATLILLNHTLIACYLSLSLFLPLHLFNAWRRSRLASNETPNLFRTLQYYDSHVDSAA